MVKDELEAFPFIVFAICFGSQTQETATPISDIDAGIYLEDDEIDLTVIGQVIAALEKCCSRKIDLVILNALFKKNPLLSFRIISEGRLLFCRDETSLISFKKNTYLYYIDVKPLLARINSSFLDRLNSGRFGERNYASTA